MSQPLKSLGELVRYRVLLHNSPGRGLLSIAQVVRDLTRFGEAEARACMWGAYHHGCAEVLRAHLERAELYVEQFAERGLTVTLERA